jgi:hypothetical protein
MTADVLNEGEAVMTRKSWASVLPLMIILASGGADSAAASGTALRDNIGVADISGGEQSNPVWGSEIGNDEFRRLLKRSLDSAGMIERARGEGRYALSAVLESIDQPNVGLGLTVTTHVQYTLTDRKSGNEVYRESIACEYSTKSWDSLMQSRRLEKAVEGAVRANTALLTEKLFQLSLPQEAASLLQ